MDKNRTDQLAEWWAVIQSRGDEAFSQPWAPLMNLAGCEQMLGKPAGLRITDVAVDDAPVSLPGESSFKGARMDILLALRYHLATSQDLQTTLAWAEKLMRYCEVYNPSLKKRALQKWGAGESARIGMLHLGAFLLDTYFYTWDVRFLNTVLKIMDKGWIYSSKDISRNLRAPGERFTHALFQFRLSLMSSCAMDRLHAEVDR